MSTSCLILEYILLILLKVPFTLVKFAGLSLVMEDFLHFLKVCTEFCLCCVTSSHPLFVSDPSVSRYHVQWMPEYCSHNETRGPEKSVTQVSQKTRQTRALHSFQTEVLIAECSVHRATA